MKKKQIHHIQEILFRRYFVTMLIILLSTTLIFTILHLYSLHKHIKNEIAVTSQNILDNVDGHFKEMDTVAINTLYSNLIKSSFTGYLNPDTPADKQNNAKALSDLMFASIGANTDICQINLYNNAWEGFGSGIYSGRIDPSPSTRSWFRSAISADGRRYITLPYLGKDGGLTSVYSSDLNFISVCRAYFNFFNGIDGVVQITEKYDSVFSSLRNVRSSYDPTFYIYDSSGQQLFPLVKSESTYFSLCGEAPEDSFLMRDPYSDQWRYFNIRQADYSNIWIVTSVGFRSFIHPLANFFFAVVAAILIVVSACHRIARYLSHKIASPLIAMHDYLNSIDFEHYTWNQMPIPVSNVIEIDELNKGLNRFQRKLKGTMEDLLLLQQQEAQSYILSLQAQMNPHFLYNSLATIRSMSEEGMMEKVSEMCDTITEILRYLSSNESALVRLDKELEYTDLYLECLQNRYGDQFTYDIEVDDSMLDIYVPKLSLQLLVENAIKYTTISVAPPWHIAISCKSDETTWAITVSDNGTGFDSEILAKLEAQINEIERTGLLPSLHIKGMGLLNIYIRLKLLFKSNYIFQYGNLDNGGAYVKIGGVINDKTRKI